MTRLRFQLHQTRRATAWLLFLLTAWMGTGGVLHHTDEGALCPAGHHSMSGIHRLTAAAPADTCAACEWTQGLQCKTLSVYHLQSPSLLPRLHSPTSRAVCTPPHSAASLVPRPSCLPDQLLIFFRAFSQEDHPMSRISRRALALAAACWAGLPLGAHAQPPSAINNPFNGVVPPGVPNSNIFDPENGPDHRHTDRRASACPCSAHGGQRHIAERGGH